MESTKKILDVISRSDSDHCIDTLDIMYDAGIICDEGIREYLINMSVVCSGSIVDWIFGKIITLLTEEELIKILERSNHHFHTKIIMPNEEYCAIVKSIPIEKLDIIKVFLYHPPYVLEEYASNIPIKQLIFCIDKMNYIDNKNRFEASIEVLKKVIIERIQEESDILCICHAIALVGPVEDLILRMEELLNDSNKYYFASILLPIHVYNMDGNRSCRIELDTKCKSKMIELFETKYGQPLTDLNDQHLYFCYIYYAVISHLRVDFLKDDNSKLIELIKCYYIYFFDKFNRHPEFSNFNSRFVELFSTVDFNNLPDLSNRAEQLRVVMAEFDTFIKSD